MGDQAELGRGLERRVAGFFRANGYDARCNEVLEGRSGGRHEVDVLAEKSDQLTTYRLAVECKAWQQPIEKDVVSKLHYILGDLGLNKGIIVSLGGCRAGAERTAADLGIDLWGPDELRRHLGESVVDELRVPATTRNAALGWGYGFAHPAPGAERTIRSAGKGWMGLRTLEDLLHFSPAWLPAYSVRLTVAQPDVKHPRRGLRSWTIDNLYEALGGQFLGPVTEPWEQVQMDQHLAISHTVRDSRLQAGLRKVVQDFSRVSSPAAVERHAAALDALGLPAPCSSLSIDATSLVYLPVYIGILASGGHQRVLAVNGRTGQICELVSRLLTENLGQLRSQFR